MTKIFKKNLKNCKIYQKIAEIRDIKIVKTTLLPQKIMQNLLSDSRGDCLVPEVVKLKK